MDVFNKILEVHERTFLRELARLKQFCEDEHVKEFVKLALAAVDTANPDHDTGEALLMLLYEIGYYIPISPSNLSLSWPSELNSFIGNYFYDDSYFTVFHNTHTGVWKAKTDNDNGYHDPRILIEAAKDITAFYRECNRLENAHDKATRNKWCDYYSKGMQSSGEVEKLLVKRRPQ